MWAIANRTQYKAKGTWARDIRGAHEWIVAVKGVFDIYPNGGVGLADEQMEPLLAPEFNGEDGTSSVRYDADLLAPKPTTDIIVNGTAYAPGGRPSTDFLIGLKVSSIVKTLRVKGNRRWGDGAFRPSQSAIEPVTQLPVVYERAYGGYDNRDPDPKNHCLDSRNPVGCGVVAEASHRSGQAVPNFEYPAGDLEKAGPAGFGVIDTSWTPRRELAGTYDEAWQQNRLPLLPTDWDPHSLLCSPNDQRPDAHFRGGELVELTNLTADGKLVFSLPKIRLAFKTRIDTRFEEHRARLSTVIIEPDYPRVIMVWVTSIPCPVGIDYLEKTVVREKSFIV